MDHVGDPPVWYSLHFHRITPKALVKSLVPIGKLCYREKVGLRYRPTREKTRHWAGCVYMAAPPSLFLKRAFRPAHALSSSKKPAPHFRLNTTPIKDLT